MSMMQWLLTISVIIFAGLAQSNAAETAAERNIVANGSFELDADKDAVPDNWRTSGHSKIQQRITIDVGHDGKRCVKLECTHFENDSPSAHAMVCQVGVVSVRAGKWYRLTFWAKSSGVNYGVVNVALSNTRVWSQVGLTETFVAQREWRRHEVVFRAKDDLPGEISRLQFWFKSTGTLWLDDVSLVETTERRRWHPEVPTQGVKNFIPNSSFECGSANWGSFTYGLRGWGGNLYRLYGELDATTAAHGKQSIKIALTPETLPVFYFDYFDAVRQPARRVLVANRGWFRVKPDQKLTLSAFMRADRDNVAALMVVCQGEGAMLRQQVKIGTKWRRSEFTFTPSRPFIFVAVGVDLEESKLDAATLWLDAVQLERGERATEYEPRHTVEAFTETSVLGNIFTQVQDGITVTLRAFNNAKTEQTLRGALVATDFFDRTASARELTLSVPPQSSLSQTLRRICAGRRGFFRLKWKTETSSQSHRCAIIEQHHDEDSPIGMNHAYPWQFLLRLAKLAGITWWRDWTAKWHVVEPEKGKFDFTAPDEQILRVVEAGAHPLVLLPFPSSSWSTTAREEDIEKASEGRSYLRRRFRVAYKPREASDFGKYAAEVVKRYRKSVRAYQILNEPLYTTYALPRRFGHTLDDYLRLLEVAHRSMKAADPECTIVGGIGAGPDAPLVRELVERGGLRFVDVLDLHFYRPPIPTDAYEEAFKSLRDLMEKNGGAKPVWITEYGCYADDDPPCTPHTVGDSTMNRCKWPTERDAAEHIVKFTAMTFAYGVRKIFFHAGTCGAINRPDAGGVFFEYGGAPRKMYAAVAALTNLLGTPSESLRSIDRDGVKCYIFRAKARTIAVAWNASGKERKLGHSDAVRAYDIMGGEIRSKEINLTATPVYLVTDDAHVSEIIDAVSR